MNTPSEKTVTERFVATKVIEKRFNSKVRATDIRLGNPEISEPDILYMDVGIELGAVLSPRSIQIDKFEETFLREANAGIRGRIPVNIVLRLVFHEDQNRVATRPTPEFSGFRQLPKYLAGIFLYKYEHPLATQISLNQKGLLRQSNLPNVNHPREFRRFMDELIRLVNGLSDTEFEKRSFDNSDFRGNCRCIHFLVSVPAEEAGARDRVSTDPLDKMFSKKVIEKLKERKYSGVFSELLLILHNFHPLAATSFTSDMHFYSHYKDHVFNRIANLIRHYESLNFYEDIFFADFSLFAGAQDCQLIDFSTYEPRILKGDPKDGHIRGCLF